VLYSLIVSCERHGKDPLAYLRDVLTRLPAMTNQDDISMLTLANWACLEKVDTGFKQLGCPFSI
jgi:hypothetical protein